MPKDPAPSTSRGRCVRSRFRHGKRGAVAANSCACGRSLPAVGFFCRARLAKAGEASPSGAAHRGAFLRTLEAGSRPACAKYPPLRGEGMVGRGRSAGAGGRSGQRRRRERENEIESAPANTRKQMHVRSPIPALALNPTSPRHHNKCSKECAAKVPGREQGKTRGSPRVFRMKRWREGQTAMALATSAA